MSDPIEKRFDKSTPKPKFTFEEYQRHDKLKIQGLENVLGKMYHTVGHSIIPFQVGGMVDMYYFPNALEGTCFATMELIEPDGSGPQPTEIGTYELVAFSKYKIGDEISKDQFNQIDKRLRVIFTTLGRYSNEATLNPMDTVEVPVGNNEPNRCVILDEYKKPGVDFMIGKSHHGLLLVIEVFRREMEYAMKHGSQNVLNEFKNRGYYPYSDLDREPVF